MDLSFQMEARIANDPRECVSIQVDVVPLFKPFVARPRSGSPRRIVWNHVNLSGHQTALRRLSGHDHLRDTVALVRVWQYNPQPLLGRLGISPFLMRDGIADMHALPIDIASDAPPFQTIRRNGGREAAPAWIDDEVARLRERSDQSSENIDRLLPIVVLFLLTFDGDRVTETSGQNRFALGKHEDWNPSVQHDFLFDVLLVGDVLQEVVIVHT